MECWYSETRAILIYSYIYQRYDTVFREYNSTLVIFLPKSFIRKFQDILFYLRLRRGNWAISQHNYK